MENYKQIAKEAGVSIESAGIDGARLRQEG